MNNELLEYTIQTTQRYTEMSQRYLLNILEEEKYITEKKDDPNKEAIYVGELTKKQKFNKAILASNNVIKTIEKWEFNKCYKYSLLYVYKSIDEKVFDTLLTNGKIVDYNSIEEFEMIYDKVQKPSYLVSEDNKIYLKFNIKYFASDNQGQEIKERHPICVVINQNNNTIEFRFDSMKYNTNDRFKLVMEAVEWVKSNVTDNLVNLDTKKILENIIKLGEYKEAFVFSQNMKMSNGMVATVSVGTCDTNVLPFIGELQELLIDNEEIFNEAPKIKTILQNFLDEKIKLSEYPKVNIKFKNKSDAQVQITFNYGLKGFDLFHHYSDSKMGNIGKERMDYVTDYIITTRDDFEKDETARSATA